MKKRKRAKKKGKAAKPKAGAAVSGDAVSADEEQTLINLITLSREDHNGGHDVDDDDENQSAMEVDTPSSTGTDQPLHLASINPDGSIDKAAATSASVGGGKGVGRVKVKIKSSKILESRSDTDRSSPVQNLGLEKQGEGSWNSAVPEIKMYVSRRPGSIKIKSSSSTKVMGGGSSSGDVVVVEDEDEGLPNKELETPSKENRYDKKELDSALLVIKKVMKMDAAEPFNVPVNPDALGIPDYFDIINTPMDFGTICSNLEKGDKYMNSKDVYKDVKYIWDNCFKYNSKGDYILDLMKRVRKNFMKYWTTAGLYTELSKGSDGAEGVHGEEELAASSHVHIKSVPPKKSKKRHGRRHKLDCLCAICVLKRRRREREENARLTKGQIGDADNELGQESKQEESSLAGSPCEDSSSNMGESLDPDAYVEVEGKAHEGKVEVTERQQSPVEKREDEEDEEEEEEDEDDEDDEMEVQKQGKDELPEKSQFTDGSGDQQPQPVISENANIHIHTQKDALVLHEEETITVQKNKRKLQELQEREEKVKVFKKFYIENPLLLNLCGTLFPDNQRSVWSGPHSLVQHQDSGRTSSIRTAIETFMK
ncbi:DNA-BINDING BROMODOMAIN-CONTAINING PROTEIN [Salix viminalis]|uniref:DNA-BINDING BROMODOMAIN-CONTAINING PROTEIN n=1 Tax=Salix viminalis TaxID=40686 RepID=A0A6N2MBJ7_SALVM|nr:DNA-BINDING BROMODOMAIN-CONTAINING PROTEIN [Salix viminalis]KAJ6715525.1 DNA-BINDING BROMODOMAIN-CONTAINING PROTEIN [Salix viminalis]